MTTEQSVGHSRNRSAPDDSDVCGSARQGDAVPQEAAIPYAVVAPTDLDRDNQLTYLEGRDFSRWIGLPTLKAPAPATQAPAPPTSPPGETENPAREPSQEFEHVFAPGLGTWSLLGALLLVGAVIGGLVTGLTGPTYTAVTLVQGAPARLDPGALTQEDDRYVQTEAAYAGLSDTEVGAALTDQLGRSDITPASVTVVPGTTILRFVGSGDTAQQAADVANISAQTYVTSWRGRMSTALTESLAVIDSAAPTTLDSSGQLAALRATLGTQLEAVQSLQRIVQPASAQTSEPAANYAPGVVLGALIGATCGLALALWQRRRTLGAGRAS